MRHSKAPGDKKHPSTQKDAARLRRSQRYTTRAALGESAPARFGGSVSTLERVRDCGRCPVGNSSVGVRVSNKDGQMVGGFSGLETCGSAWACPVCAAKVAARRCEEVTGALTQHTGAGGAAVMVTLTMRHNKRQTLGYCWDNLAAAWKAATNGAGWRADRQEFGILGFTRVVEVTHGKKSGWHVHVHALLFLEDGNTAPALLNALGHRMFGRWAAKLKAVGMSSPIAEKGGLDVRVIYGVEDIGPYLMKVGGEGDATPAARAAAMEATRGDLKNGRKENRTPWQVLGDFVATGDLDDLRLWQEYEQASKGRRKIMWTRRNGSPVWDAVLDARGQELTDEEVAAEDHGGETVAYIEAADWRAVVKQDRTAPARLLTAAETGGFMAVRACLAAFGVSAYRYPPGAARAA